MPILKAEESAPVEGVEAMAFQMILVRLQALERTIQAMPPLLKQIVELLEEQTTTPDVPVAAYEDVYKEDTEPDAEETALAGMEAPTVAVAPPHWRVRWFVKEKQA